MLCSFINAALVYVDPDEVAETDCRIDQGFVRKQVVAEFHRRVLRQRGKDAQRRLINYLHICRHQRATNANAIDCNDHKGFYKQQCSSQTGDVPVSPSGVCALPCSSLHLTYDEDFYCFTINIRVICETLLQWCAPVECCRVDSMSLEHMVVGLPACWCPLSLK